MPGERIQRQIDRLLDEADAAAASGEWARVQALCRRVLTLDPASEDATGYLAAAERGLQQAAGDGGAAGCVGATHSIGASVTRVIHRWTLPSAQPAG